jgi:putative addiction module component (TIGR02574 family)
MTSAIDMAPILSLPVAQRFEVMGAIWDSLADEPTAGELTDEVKAELKRRLDAFRADPSIGIPWEEVKARMLARRRG